MSHASNLLSHTGRKLSGIASRVDLMSTYILVPGLWLGAWAWHDVTVTLRADGHDAYPLTLTGLADRSHLLGPDIDLDTHIEDIVRLAEAEDLHDIVLVGHSYAGLPVSAAALRLKDRIKAVVYVDAGAQPEGTSQWDSTPPEDQAASPDDAVALDPREWDPAADPHMLAGLDERALGQLRTRSTPHPMASVKQAVGAHATSADMPTVLISCAFPMETVKEMMAAGHPWFVEMTDARIIPLPTGHWPMLSEPKALAEILASL
jgi:pimeloyl-ACP methyl ester carboxylesterase